VLARITVANARFSDHPTQAGRGKSVPEDWTCVFFNVNHPSRRGSEHLIFRRCVSQNRVIRVRQL